LFLVRRLFKSFMFTSVPLWFQVTGYSFHFTCFTDWAKAVIFARALQHL
jgi:hypothetical protein